MAPAPISANLINEATLLAVRKDRHDVSMADVEEAIDRLLAGLKRKRVMSVHGLRIVPRAISTRMSTALAPWLLDNPWFVRHVVLDRWFLHARALAML